MEFNIKQVKKRTARNDQTFVKTYKFLHAKQNTDTEHTFVVLILKIINLYIEAVAYYDELTA